MIGNLMMSPELATPGLLKIKVVWNKDYDVIIFVHDATNKILSRGSNSILDAFMRPKFSNSSTSRKELNIVSVL